MSKKSPAAKSSFAVIFSGFILFLWVLFPSFAADDLPEYRTGGIPVGGYHDHIPRPGDLQRFVDHEVVTGPGIHGYGHSAEGQPRPRNHAGIHEMETAHCVGEVGDHLRAMDRKITKFFL